MERVDSLIGSKNRTMPISFLSGMEKIPPQKKRTATVLKFGARLTGKTSLLKRLFTGALYLLAAETRFGSGTGPKQS